MLPGIHCLHRSLTLIGDWDADAAAPHPASLGFGDVKLCSKCFLAQPSPWLVPIFLPSKISSAFLHSFILFLRCVSELSTRFFHICVCIFGGGKERGWRLQLLQESVLSFLFCWCWGLSPELGACWAHAKTRKGCLLSSPSC